MRRAITGMKGSRRLMAGLSLIELMVALVLGLLVVAAAIGIFLSNRQTYRTTAAMPAMLRVNPVPSRGSP